MKVHSIELFLPFFPNPLENNIFIQEIFDELLMKNLKIKEIKYNTGKNKDKIIYIFNDNYKGNLISVGYSRGILINYEDEI